MRVSFSHFLEIISLFLLSIFFNVVNAAPLDLLPKHCHFSSKFEQEKKLKSLPVPIKSSGRMYFSCKLGLIWQTQTPIQESLILTNSGYHFKQINNSKTPETELEVLDSLEIRFLSRLLIGLMSSDTTYINKNFSVTRTTEQEFELTPTNNFIRKAIKAVNIQKPDDESSLLINIDQKDGTIINIKPHSIIVLKDSANNDACLQNNYKKTHCQALFDPLKVAAQLSDNIEN